MPFDGIIAQHTHIRDALANETSLSSKLAEIGIIAVPDAVLEQHKANEIRQHPASRLWMCRHFIGVLTACIACLWIASLPVIIIALANHSPSLGILSVGMLVLLILAITLAAQTELVGPATWIENPILYLPAHSMPLSLRTLARQVKLSIPDLQFVIGTLYQEQHVLDPYLLVERINEVTGKTERACLGIWDGMQIIKIADCKAQLS